MISYILATITGVLVLGLDQFTKWWVFNYYSVNNLDTEKHVIKFIPGVIQIVHAENDGAALGFLGGYPFLLVSITIVVILAVIALLLKYGTRDKLVFWSSCLILSGGVGNLIDRIFREGLVRDFLQFEFWLSYPVFNVADCAIVVGTCLIVFYLIKSIFDEQKQKTSASKLTQTKEESQDENV